MATIINGVQILLKTISLKNFDKSSKFCWMLEDGVMDVLTKYIFHF